MHCIEEILRFNSNELEDFDAPSMARQIELQCKMSRRGSGIDHNVHGDDVFAMLCDKKETVDVCELTVTQ